MQNGWLIQTLGGRKVEHIPCPHPGGMVDTHAPAAGVLHTIEGGLESGLGVFRQHFAPHFTLDGERTIQLVPLGFMAGALENRPGGVETNSITRAQIEVAGKSQQKPWICDGPCTEALADLLATLEKTAEIPLERPFDDAMPGLPWASTNFERRRANKWGKVAGWYGHVEVPENEHWDPGALQWSKVIERARVLAGGGVAPKPKPLPNPEQAPKPVPDWYWHWLSWQLGENEFKAFGPRSADNRPEEAPAKIPAWAWVKAGQFTSARNQPH